MIDLTDPVFIAVFIGIWVVYLWESYLHYRQVRYTFYLAIVVTFII